MIHTSSRTRSLKQVLNAGIGFDFTCGGLAGSVQVCGVFFFLCAPARGRKSRTGDDSAPSPAPSTPTQHPLGSTLLSRADCDWFRWLPFAVCGRDDWLIVNRRPIICFYLGELVNRFRGFRRDSVPSFFISVNGKYKNHEGVLFYPKLTAWSLKTGCGLQIRCCTVSSF